MGQIDLNRYKNLYLQTAKEYVGKMLVSLDKLANDAADKEALTNLHLCSHSLASQSQMAGLTNVADLSGVIEKISNSALEDGDKINSDLIPVLKESVEELGLCISQIEKVNIEKDLGEFIKKLKSASGII